MTSIISENFMGGSSGGFLFNQDLFLRAEESLLSLTGSNNSIDKISQITSSLNPQLLDDTNIYKTNVEGLLEDINTITMMLGTLVDYCIPKTKNYLNELDMIDPETNKYLEIENKRNINSSIQQINSRSMLIDIYIKSLEEQKEFISKQIDDLYNLQNKYEGKFENREIIELKKQLKDIDNQINNLLSQGDNIYVQRLVYCLNGFIDYKELGFASIDDCKNEYFNFYYNKYYKNIIIDGAKSSTNSSDIGTARIISKNWDLFITSQIISDDNVSEAIKVEYLNKYIDSAKDILRNCKSNSLEEEELLFNTTCSLMLHGLDFDTDKYNFDYEEYENILDLAFVHYEDRVNYLSVNNPSNKKYKEQLESIKDIRKSLAYNYWFPELIFYEAEFNASNIIEWYGKEYESIDAGYYIVETDKKYLIEYYDQQDYFMDDSRELIALDAEIATYKGNVPEELLQKRDRLCQTILSELIAGDVNIAMYGSCHLGTLSYEEDDKLQSILDDFIFSQEKSLVDYINKSTGDEKKELETQLQNFYYYKATLIMSGVISTKDKESAEKCVDLYVQKQLDYLEEQKKNLDPNKDLRTIKYINTQIEEYKKWRDNYLDYAEYLNAKRVIDALNEREGYYSLTKEEKINELTRKYMSEYNLSELDAHAKAVRYLYDNGITQKETLEGKYLKICAEKKELLGIKSETEQAIIDIFNMFKDSFMEYVYGVRDIFTEGDFSRLFIVAPLKTAATLTTVGVKTGAGLLRIAEGCLDGAVFISGGAFSLVAGIWDEELSSNAWNGTMDFIGTDLVGVGENWLWNSDIGDIVSYMSYLDPNSAGADLIESGSTAVGEIIIAALLTFATGGAAAPFAVGFFEGMGFSTEKYAQEMQALGKDYNGLVALLKGLAGGIGSGHKWAGFGKMGSGFITNLIEKSAGTLTLETATAIFNNYASTMSSAFANNLFTIDNYLEVATTVFSHVATLISGEETLEEFYANCGSELIKGLVLNCIFAYISAGKEVDEFNKAHNFLDNYSKKYNNLLDSLSDSQKALFDGLVNSNGPIDDSLIKNLLCNLDDNQASILVDLSKMNPNLGNISSVYDVYGNIFKQVDAIEGLPSSEKVTLKSILSGDEITPSDFNKFMDKLDEMDGYDGTAKSKVYEVLFNNAEHTSGSNIARSIDVTTDGIDIVADTTVATTTSTSKATSPFALSSYVNEDGTIRSEYDDFYKRTMPENDYAKKTSDVYKGADGKIHGEVYGTHLKPEDQLKRYQRLLSEGESESSALRKMLNEYYAQYVPDWASNPETSTYYWNNLVKTYDNILANGDNISYDDFLKMQLQIIPFDPKTQLPNTYALWKAAYDSSDKIVVFYKPSDMKGLTTYYDNGLGRAATDTAGSALYAIPEASVQLPDNWSSMTKSEQVAWVSGITQLDPSKFENGCYMVTIDKSLIPSECTMDDLLSSPFRRGANGAWGCGMCPLGQDVFEVVPPRIDNIIENLDALKASGTLSDLIADGDDIGISQYIINGIASGEVQIKTGIDIIPII